MKLGRDVLYDNAHYHFEAYGLQNPFVQEAIRLGAYNPGPCFSCKGEGGRRGKDIFGEDWFERCWQCGGSGIHDPFDTRIFEEDFLGAEDMRVAARLGIYPVNSLTRETRPRR